MQNRVFSTILTLLIGACSVACSDGTPSSAAAQPLVLDEPVPSHPSLIVRESDYPALRAKALQSPWTDLAIDALVYARDESFDPAAGDFDAKTKMTDLCGALALAYVLDPRPSRANKVRDTLAHWQTFFMAEAPPGSGVLVRWRQSAMIQSIIALDVVHGGLAPADRVFLEDMLDAMILEWWAKLDQDGTPSTPGVVATWAIYKGYRGLAQEAANLYLERLSVNLAPSGVYDSGPGYAWVRQGSDRLSKYALIDILEFTGRNPSRYTDARLRTLHEWMYRGAYTPRRTNLTFGDSDPTRPIEGLLGYIQPYRANKFSALAGRNAAWVVRDVRPRPLLSNFVLMDSTVTTPEAPTSAVWGDTASFWEEVVSDESLMGALWNARTSGGHSHRDVNAVHLYAYGENVLRNSGYCGSGIGIDATFDWNWVFQATASNNTVTIAGGEHDEKFGGGIVEGLTAPRFDYAAGDAGPALETGTHTRSLLMVHGETGRPGYFALLDEVQTAAPGTEVNVNLHPDSNAATPLVAAQEYQWSIQHFGAKEVRLNLFLGTRPAVAELLDGGLCAFDGLEYVGKYLRSTYLAGATGQANIVTLAVPSDLTHPKPTLTRISGGALFSGAAVNFPGGVTDYVLASPGTAPVVLGASFFQGKNLHARFAGGSNVQYFVRKGRGFFDGALQPTGFESDSDVTVFVRDTQAFVTSAGATVVFDEPALTGNVFSSPVGTVLSAGVGFVQIALLPGTHRFDLNTGATLP